VTDEVDPDARNRAAKATEYELGAGTLVGSYFQHWETDELVEQGIVVAEPQAGVYLLAVYAGDAETVRYQRLWGIDRMIDSDEGQWRSEWRFFDSPAWLMTIITDQAQKEAGR
jgi:hypothetical protein